MLVRFLAFAGIFLLMAALETLAPRRQRNVDRSTRWITNLSIVGIDVMIVRLMALLPGPLVATAAALYAEKSGFGLWHWLDGRKEQACAAWEKVLTSPNWSAFGFIAAEAELARGACRAGKKR